VINAVLRDRAVPVAAAERSSSWRFRFAGPIAMHLLSGGITFEHRPQPGEKPMKAEAWRMFIGATPPTGVENVYRSAVG